MIRIIFIMIACQFLADKAISGNTSGVVGPNIDGDDESFEYRISYNPKEDSNGQRVHYQKSINEYWQPRFVLLTRSLGGSDTEIDAVKAEMKHQITEDDAKWLSGVRFDITYRGQDRPTTFDVIGTTETDFIKGTKIRFNALLGVDFGKNSRSGAFVRTRARISKKFNHGFNLGLDSFNNYGSTSDFEGFQEQSHQVGPYLSFKYKSFSFNNSILLGLSDKASDINYRLFVGRSF